MNIFIYEGSLGCQFERVFYLPHFGNPRMLCSEDAYRTIIWYGDAARARRNGNESRTCARSLVRFLTKNQAVIALNE